MPSRTAANMSPAQLKQYRPFQRLVGKGLDNPLAVAARETAASIAAELKGRFGAKKVALFGSLVSGDFSAWSDIDLAVWGILPQDYYRAVSLASGFSERFKVDLVDADDCAESLRQRICEEGVEL